MQFINVKIMIFIGLIMISLKSFSNPLFSKIKNAPTLKKCIKHPIKDNQPWEYKVV
tara:strand:- start:571 stop:738 length:168 start_codon:yes stop_codon:yes gene_type:complete